MRDREVPPPPADLAALELLARVEAGDAAAAATLFADGRSWVELSGPTRLRLAVAELRHVLAHPEGFPDDRARELYSTLLDEWGPTHDPAIRALGEQLHTLEDSGALPRSMVVRSRRRRE